MNNTFRLREIVPILAFGLISCSPPPDNTTQTRFEEMQKKIETQDAAIIAHKKTITESLDKQVASLEEMQKKIEAQDAAINSYKKTTTEYLDKQVTLMKQSLANLAELFSALQEQVRAEVASLRQSIHNEETAVLDPTSKGYSSVSTDKGVFLFSVADAIPFLDGHKIVLEIGNPMNMTFQGFKLRIRHGRRPPPIPSVNIGETNAARTIEQWIEDRRVWEKTLRKVEFSFTDSLPPGAWSMVDFTLKETKPEDVAYLEVSIETDTISLRKPLRDTK